MKLEKNHILKPVTSIDNFYHDTPRIVIHSHINSKGTMHLSKAEAALLIVELWKFINDEYKSNDIYK